MDIDALFEDDIEKRLETLNPDTCLEVRVLTAA